MSLPTSRRFITQLLDSLPLSADTTISDANPLSAVPETAKKQLLSLQVLFPNEFLPALDLLDRRLVTRLRIEDGGKRRVDLKTDGGVEAIEDNATTHSNKPTAEDNTASTGFPVTESPHIMSDDHTMTDTHPIEVDATSHNDLHAIYYVGSAQQRSSRFSTSYDTTTSYEVRLLAWNCSCPAFAFAAFPATHPEPLIPTYEPNKDEEDAATRNTQSGAWLFGGVSLGDAIPPVCKHLLACVLVEKCNGLFSGFVEERAVSVEEAAGWAAGWGD
jgi:hypothetical protein